MIIIEDYTYADSGTEPFTILVDNDDNNQEVILPIKLGRVEPIDFPVKNRCKRRKFKSYLGKSYEAENR